MTLTPLFLGICLYGISFPNANVPDQACKESPPTAEVLSGDGTKALALSNELEFGACRDHERAERWLRISAGLGNADAQMALGNEMVSRGDEASWHEGIGWLLRAVRAREERASLSLARALKSRPREDYSQSAKGWFLRAAQAGSVPAMVEIAREGHGGGLISAQRQIDALAWAMLACRLSSMGSVTHGEACGLRDQSLSSASKEVKAAAEQKYGVLIQGRGLQR